MTQGAERDELRVWERARLARDERFDGRFFVGVTSTGIYCRPICPAPRPKPAHVRYFASAAAAAEAGFRPCLRCRPEASPGTPAWVGAPTSVTRALKLIGESALDDGGVDELAERLGIGARHLRRLFLKHLGATPVAVAQTRRVHFAKRLIDETSLPMTQVAFAAGFGSVRRFNATFRELYGCPPRELRRNGWRRGRGEGNCYTFRLAYRPPYDWDSMLRFLAARATPGVETVEGNEYRRTIKVDGQAGWIAVRRASGNALTAEIRFPAPAKLFQIVERVRRMFDLSADPRAIAAVLRRDARLAGLVRRWPGLRVPGCWSRFELAVRAVLGQQISVRAASTLAGRLAEALGVQTPEGRLFPASEAVAAADLEGLGITGRRAQAIRELARRRSAGGLSLGRLAGPGEVEGALTQIAGVGPWTAQYIAMRLGEPDAFPGTDRYLAAFAEKAEAWRPWRAYAAMYIWNEAANT